MQAFTVVRSPSPSSAAASTSNDAASIGRIGSLNGFNNSSPEYHSSPVHFQTQTQADVLPKEFINGTDQQFACPPTLTKEQREIVHQLADELNLKHESKGNWRRRILFVYKTEFINPNPRGFQLVYNALQSRTLLPQLVNQNVMDVVNAPASSRTENIPAKTQAVRRKKWKTS
jgi:hypothetical protein